MNTIEHVKEWFSDFKEKTLKEKLSVILPYGLCMFIIARIAELYRLCRGNLYRFIKNIPYIYKVFPPHFALNDLVLGVSLGFFIVCSARWSSRMHAKNTKFGEEYGSARWGTEKDIKPFIDEDPFNNIILSQTERLSMKARMPKFNLNRNKHVIVYGGSGSGKTYGFVKPNLYQLHSSYVLTDPKGTLLPETGNLFEKKGYNIYVLDTIDMKSSMHYNPFAYIKQPKDILTLANVLYANLKPPDAGTPPDPFFDQAALLWLQATIGYLWYEAPPEEQNIPTLLEILDADDVREDDEGYQNAVDMLFEELEKKNPKHFAVKQRKKYKKAAGVIKYKRLLNQNKYKRATA